MSSCRMLCRISPGGRPGAAPPASFPGRHVGLDCVGNEEVRAAAEVFASLARRFLVAGFSRILRVELRVFAMNTF